jgi:hypothetical protein
VKVIDIKIYYGCSTFKRYRYQDFSQCYNVCSECSHIRFYSHSSSQQDEQD